MSSLAGCGSVQPSTVQRLGLVPGASTVSQPQKPQQEDWYGKYHIICDGVHLPGLFATKPSFPSPAPAVKKCEIRKYREDGMVCTQIEYKDYRSGLVFPGR